MKNSHMLLLIIIIFGSFLECHKVSGIHGGNLHTWLPRSKYKPAQPTKQPWMMMTKSTKLDQNEEENNNLIISLNPKNDSVMIQQSQFVDHQKFIEGTGPFQCFLELNKKLEKRSRLVQNIGQYHCTFPMGPSIKPSSSSSKKILFKGVGKYDCFFGQHFENFQGTGPYQCEFWLPLPPPSSCQTAMRKNTDRRRIWGPPASGNLLINDVDEIEGTGSYLCIFRGSEEGGQVFVRDVGNFRCNFQGGQKTKNSVIGLGYYQCHFQKPGSLQLIRVGVGLYICFLAGVRRIRGFPQEISPPTEKSSFFEILGSVTGSLNRTSFAAPDFSGGSADPAGHLQLLGLYQFGPAGSQQELDFGFIQAVESYGFSLENRTQLNNQNQLTSVLSRVNQMGQFQYAFKGSNLDEGRKQINRNLGYNVMRRFYNYHTLHFHTIIYDYAGEQRVLGQNEDFIQCWAYYEYDNLEVQEVDVRLMTFAQYNLHSGLLDWVQLIGELDYDFVISDGRGQGFLGLATVYQSNNEEWIGPSQIFGGGGDGGQIIISDLILTSIRFTYTIPPAPQHPEESGLLIIYGNYNYYLQLPQESAGWIYVLVRYDRVTEGNGDTLLRPKGTVSSIRAIALYELDFPDMTLNNGMWHVLVNYAIDLNVVGRSLGSNLVDGPPLNGVVTFSGLLQCLFFGSGNEVNYIYYVVLTISYEVNTASFNMNGTQQQNSNWAGQKDVRILAQFFQEIRNDNVQNGEDDEDNFI